MAARVTKFVRPGDVTITPVGEPKRFQHGGEIVVILLKLAPAFVQDGRRR